MKTFAQWAEDHGLSESEKGVAEAAWQAALSAQPSPGGQGELAAIGDARAARQPVAMRVTPEMRAEFRRAFREGGFWSDRLDTALDAMMRAAPPTQAVDLGQLPRAVELLSNVARTLVDWAADEQREAIDIVKALLDSRVKPK